MSFTNLGLSPALITKLAELNYTEAYPIQQQAIPVILGKKDILGIAKTGSGKTISYALPLLMQSEQTAISKNRHVKALILVPTRELAMQVNEVFQQFSPALTERIKTLAVFGGVSINPQMIALQNVDILIATPGRLLELADSNAVHLSEISTLVLDEADKMLSLGFKEELDKILALLPQKRQNLLFSATLNENISAITQMVLYEPIVIKIDETEENSIDLITQSAYYISEEKKGPLLRFLIKQKEMKQVLVFTSSVFRADAVAVKLKKNGIEAKAIHSKKSQGARTKALQSFKSGELTVLVATDLIARGIDIEFLPFVINYELPRSPQDYIHRIGRTGRAENPGEAISLISPEEEHHFKIIQKKMGKWVVTFNGDDLI
jgi:ATP-dependent RNA helicase RhlE